MHSRFRTTKIKIKLCPRRVTSRIRLKKRHVNPVPRKLRIQKSIQAITLQPHVKLKTCIQRNVGQ